MITQRHGSKWFDIWPTFTNVQLLMYGTKTVLVLCASLWYKRMSFFNLLVFHNLLIETGIQIRTPVGPGFDPT